MTIKQILFSVLILSTVNNMTFTSETSDESNPSIFLKYSFIDLNDYEVKPSIMAIPLNQEKLKNLKELGREKDFVVCNFKGENDFKKSIHVYSTKSEFLKEFNDCEILAHLISKLSENDQIELLKHILPELLKK